MEFNTYLISKQTILSNLNAIKNLVNPKTKICAVVKADAYSLGARNVCEILKGRVDFFAVNSFKEAIKIRSFDKQTNILILGKTDKSDYEICAKNNISISVFCIDDLASVNLSEKLNVHIKVNSGMNRFGTNSLDEFKLMVKAIKNSNSFNLEGVFTHYHFAEQTSLTKEQFKRFMTFVKATHKKVLFHASATSGVINNPKLSLNMVRVGFGLYGQTKLTKTALTIRAKLVNVINLKAGESLGYECGFIAKKDYKIGVVSLGYADGFSRRLSNHFSVLCNGKFCRVLGYVCMDCFFIDLTNFPAKIYDDVTILGSDKENEITLNDYADALKTSPYEILTMFRRKRMRVVFKWFI